MLKKPYLVPGTKLGLAICKASTLDPSLYFFCMKITIQIKDITEFFSLYSFLEKWSINQNRNKSKFRTITMARRNIHVAIGTFPYDVFSF